MSTEDTIEEMRQRLCQTFHRNISNNMSTRKRKLVLHFDVNKTIVAVDSATGETVQDALNIYLSGMAWGKDKEGRWESPKASLSHSPTEKDDVSFYKFEEKRFQQQRSPDRSIFRCQLSSFTDRPQGSNFKPYLNMLLNNMKWTTHYDESIHKSLTVPGTENCRFHFILPAFYKLLEYLIEDEREFAIVFRTYGSDAKQVLNSIKTAINLDMPFCQKLKDMLPNISEEILALKREENGLFSLSSDPSLPVNLKSSESGCVRCDEDMHSYLKETSGICAIRDDMKVWCENNFHPTKGKPLWIDTSDSECQHIFFDDNIRAGVTDSIVNLRVRSSTDAFRNVERAEEYKYLHKNIVPVVLSEAIMDTDYFIKELELCEKNYTEELR